MTSKNELMGFVINKAAVTSTATDEVKTIYSKADTSILIGHGSNTLIDVAGAATDIRRSALNGLAADLLNKIMTHKNLLDQTVANKKP